PALAVAEADLGLLARREDMVIAFTREGAEVAVGGESWAFEPRSDDPFVRQELVETTYHVLWELVHVFLDHATGSTAGAGASTFLYPFLAPRENDVESLVHDVRRSVLAKAGEVADLRVATVAGARAELTAAAAAVRGALDRGGTLLAFGNGASPTDAMDLAA